MDLNEMSPEQAEAKTQLMASGDQAYDDEDFALALDCYHRASVLDNRDPAVWCALGMAYYNLDFNREAWRSYLLALHCNPEDPNTLWYASEFLEGVGDSQMAAILLTRYLQVEPDQQKLAEGRELLAEILATSGGRSISAEQRQAIETALLGGSEPAAEPQTQQMQDLDAENPSSLAGSSPEDADAAPEEEAAADDEYYEEEGSFVASLSLQLDGFAGLCGHCKTSIPLDAPYCYSCLMPHFYEEV